MCSKLRINIVLVIPTLERGGAELVLSRLASWLYESGQNVSVVTFNRKAYEWPIHSGITRYYIDDFRKNPDEADAIAALQKIFTIARPDVIISFLMRMNLRVLSAAHSIPVIVSERTHIPIRNIPANIKCAYRNLYPRAQFLVVLTKRCAEDWAYDFMPRDSVIVLPNPFMPRQLPPDPAPTGMSYILALGRMTHGKGFDYLIDAFAKVHTHRPGTCLLLVGEGELQTALHSQVKNAGLEKYIHFYGYSANPEQLFQHALCFVLPSLFEGFPNVLLEAMFHGVPCIASDCLTGPRELLGYQERGLLFPPGDIEALAGCLVQFYSDGHLRQALGNKAKVYARQFTEDKIFSEWLELCRIAAKQ